METSQGPIKTAEEEKPIWFGGEGKDAANEQLLLKPAKDAAGGRDRFKQKLQNFLKKNRGNAEPPKTREELEKEIALYKGDYLTLKTDALATLNFATQVNSTYNKQRREGRKKVGRVAQEFVTSFSEFLRVYSGIVDIVKGAGQIYGEVAYESLSILFLVVVNKSGNDSSIATLLDEMRKSFPQLDDWTNIYPTSSMKLVVAEVYREVITFARDASVYFTKFSTRLWMAIGNPPSIGMEKTASTIHGKLAEVTSEAMVQLHKRNQRIELTVEESKRTVEKSHLTIKRLEGMLEAASIENQRYRQQEQTERAEADSQSLETFKETLGIINFPTAASDPDIIRQNLTKAFASHKKHYYQHMNPPLLHSLSSYQSWFSSTSSSLLLLAGETNINARAGRGYTHSWLSPAPLIVVDILRENGERGAYYCAHPGVRTDDNDLDILLAKDMLVKLSYSLLKSQPSILRRRRAQLCSIINDPDFSLVDAKSLDNRKLESWEMREKQRTALACWFSLLRDVLRELKVYDAGQDAKGKFTYLVIDRMDLVELRVRYFVDELVKLVRDEEVRVKVFAVMDTVRGEWDEDWSAVDERVLAVQGLDQKVRGPFEDTLTS